MEFNGRTKLKKAYKTMLTAFAMFFIPLCYAVEGDAIHRMIRWSFVIHPSRKEVPRPEINTQPNLTVQSANQVPLQ